MRLSWPKRWQKKTHLSRELLLYSPKDFFISLLQTFIIAFLCLKKRHAHDKYKKQKHTCHHIRIRTPDIKSIAF